MTPLRRKPLAQKRVEDLWRRCCYQDPFLTVGPCPQAKSDLRAVGKQLLRRRSLNTAEADLS